MRGVFLSYRRDDSSGHAGRIYDRLSARLGKDAVFRDVDTIAPGENFVDVLRRRVEGAAVVLVIIGRHWVDARDGQGRRRLEDAGDFVRLESEMALAKKTTLIPVLVDGARMPKPEELPESLRPLCYANAVSLDEDTFDFEIDRLAGAIERTIGLKPKRRWMGWTASGAAALLVMAAALKYRAVSTPEPPAPQIATARAMAQAKDYKGAWDLLTANASAAGVTAAREDLAMEWIRGMGARDTQRDPVLPAVVDLVAPVLTAGVERSTGARKADLLAHYGWCLYLRRRMGIDVDASAPYRLALEADSANMFANVMLGHWVLLQKRVAGIEEARPYFQTALSSGRERATVRRIQLAGIENTWEDPTDGEYLRVAADMVRAQEPLDDHAIYKAQSVYYFSIADKTRKTSVAQALPPDDHIRLLTYLRERVPAEKHSWLDIWTGRMEEKAGRIPQALEAYQRVKTPPEMIDAWREEVTSALRRLSKVK